MLIYKKLIYYKKVYIIQLIGFEHIIQVQVQLNVTEVAFVVFLFVHKIILIKVIGNIKKCN